MEGLVAAVHGMQDAKVSSQIKTISGGDRVTIMVDAETASRWRQVYAETIGILRISQSLDKGRIARLDTRLYCLICLWSVNSATDYGGCLQALCYLGVRWGRE